MNLSRHFLSGPCWISPAYANMGFSSRSPVSYEPLPAPLRVVSFLLGWFLTQWIHFIGQAQCLKKPQSQSRIKIKRWRSQRMTIVWSQRMLKHAKFGSQMNNPFSVWKPSVPFDKVAFYNEVNALSTIDNFVSKIWRTITFLMPTACCCDCYSLPIIDIVADSFVPLNYLRSACLVDCSV